eukprot:gi/632962308/ref/XP_007897234.1/ PREDICTED: lymphoid enhancer-binding factor 1-like [Callorhinchus milii]
MAAYLTLSNLEVRKVYIELSLLCGTATVIIRCGAVEQCCRNSATSNKVPVVQPSHAIHPLTPLITYSDEHFAPGVHPTHIPTDVNSKRGIHRHPPGPEMPTFYPLSPGGVGQLTPPLGWQGQPIYPVSGGFRQPYPTAHPVNTPISRFSHHMMPGQPGHHATGIPHPAIVNPQIKQEPMQNESELMSMKPHHESRKEQEAKKPHIKKPLNAFMLYMKEMRANVVAECTLKESAAINQILGRRWHALTREEQAKYYELARKERQLHMQLYPGWSARDNYGKKKKRKREKMQEATPGHSPKRLLLLQPGEQAGMSTDFPGNLGNAVPSPTDRKCGASQRMSIFSFPQRWNVSLPGGAPSSSPPEN